MKRGWKVLYTDGTVLTEDDTHWMKLDLERVSEVAIVRDGREYALPKGKTGWIQAKTASAAVGGKVEIESRYVGFEEGNSQIVLRVMEATGDCIVETRPKG